MKIPVEGHSGLFRDEESRAIINCNNSEYEEYLKFEEKIRNEKNEIKQLKNELDELKNLVSKLVNK